MPDTFYTLSCLCLQQCYEGSPIILLQEAKIGGDYEIVQGQAAVKGEARVGIQACLN